MSGNGELPAGLTFNTSTGLIDGTPTTDETSELLVVTATNQYGSDTSTADSITIAPSTATFAAAVPDLSIMQLQRIGAGTPTSTHSTVINAPDFEGVYREYAIDAPVWRGGRQVGNDTFDTDAGDALLDPPPYLQSNLAATNLVFPSAVNTNAWDSNAVTANANAGPDIFGGNTATDIIEGSANDTHAVWKQSVIAAGNPGDYTVVAHLQPIVAGVQRWAKISLVEDETNYGYIVIDLTNGNITQTTGEGSMAPISNSSELVNGIIKCSLSINTGAITAINYDIAITDNPTPPHVSPFGDYIFQGDGVSGIRVLHTEVRAGIDETKSPIVTTTAVNSIVALPYFFSQSNIDPSDVTFNINVDYDGTDTSIITIGSEVLLKIDAGDMQLQDASANVLTSTIIEGKHSVKVSLSVTTMELTVDGGTLQSGAYVPIPTGAIEVNADINSFTI